MTDDAPRPIRVPLMGRNAAVERMVRERTWLLEQRVVALEREQQDLGRILRGLGEGVVAVDRAGIVIHANPAAIALLGLDESTCLGSHMFIAIPHQATCDLIEDVMRGEGRITRELVIERPEGDTVLVVAVRSLRTAGRDDGEAEGAIAVVRDVTELRRLERSRQDFFGNVSHELKTPVTAIRGSIETIMDDPEMEPEVRARFLDGARRHTVRLGTLVTDLIALARFEGDPAALDTVVIDVASIAHEVRGAAAADAERRGVRLELRLHGAGDGADWCVDGDEEALRQAASNLVDNALAHSEHGGVVRIELSRVGDAVELSVVDHGPGIPPELVERIFERFYRVDAARSRARGGTGIGLSIVKHVAQAHGGCVLVASEVGAGSTFTLRLPVSATGGRGIEPGA